MKIKSNKMIKIIIIINWQHKNNTLNTHRLIDNEAVKLAKIKVIKMQEAIDL